MGACLGFLQSHRSSTVFLCSLCNPKVYDVRLQDALGGNELLISTQPVEQTNVTVPSTSRSVYQRVAIYSKSELCVATTPAVLTLQGATLDFTVSALSMTDLDLDQGEIGGDLKWEVPRTIGPVVKFSLYLGESAARQCFIKPNCKSQTERVASSSASSEALRRWERIVSSSRISAHRPRPSPSMRDSSWASTQLDWVPSAGSF